MDSLVMLLIPFLRCGLGTGAYRHLGRRGDLQYKESEFLNVQAQRMVDGVKVLVWSS